jgi:hypothetical protein
MGRTVNRQLLGPPAVCDACGATTESLHQAGAQCYRDGCIGVLQHRSLWVYTWWPDGSLTATPREEITEGDVARIGAENQRKWARWREGNLAAD